MLTKKIILYILIIFSIKLLLSDNTITDNPHKEKNIKGMVRGLYVGFINRFKNTEKNSASNSTQTRHEYFQAYEGKTIRNIYIQNVDVFTVSEKSFLNIESTVQKLGNKLHLDTVEYYIRMELLFKAGDKVNPQRLIETERILREDRHIHSVNIVVENMPEDDEVDVYVNVRDVWSIKVAASVNLQEKKGNISLSDINFLGSSSEMFLNVKKNQEFKHGYNLDASYRYEKFYNYLSYADVYYYGNLNDTKYGFGANQNFETAYNRHLYGVNSQWVNRYTRNVENDTLATPYKIDYNKYNAWYGYAIPFSDNYAQRGLFNHLILGGNVINTNYYNTAGIDNTFFLGSVTLLRRQFYQDSHLFAFGRTEDIPIGLKMDLTIGSEIGKNNYGQYYGGSFAFSNYNDSFGYHLFDIKAGGFLHEGSWRRGVFQASTQGITKLREFNGFLWRHYHSIKYSQSINPVIEEDLLTLNSSEDILGYNLPNHYGVKRLVLNIDNNLFLPYTFYNFKTILVGFIDLGYLANKNEELFNTTLQSGFGLALRIRNEHITFATIQLVAAYYPKGSTHGISNYRYFREPDTAHPYHQMYYARPGFYGF